MKPLQYVCNYFAFCRDVLSVEPLLGIIYSSDMHFLFLFQGPVGAVGPAGAFGPRGLAVSLISKYATPLMQEEKTRFINKNSWLCSRYGPKK